MRAPTAAGRQAGRQAGQRLRSRLFAYSCRGTPVCLSLPCCLVVSSSSADAGQSLGLRAQGSGLLRLVPPRQGAAPAHGHRHAADGGQPRDGGGPADRAARAAAAGARGQLEAGAAGARLRDLPGPGDAGPVQVAVQPADARAPRAGRQHGPEEVAGLEGGPAARQAGRESQGTVFLLCFHCLSI
eukprot:SAG22_NODE_1058_length_5769_cov_6.433510_7_plen_185_part_00